MTSADTSFFVVVGIWGFKASSECLVPLVRITLSVKPPSYDTIMELDGKIRQLTPPSADILHTIFTERSHYQELRMWIFRHYYMPR